MNAVEKYTPEYGKQFDDINPAKHFVLSSFQQVLDGTAKPYVFQMTSDEWVKAVLDDEDYKIWCRAKAEAENKQRL